MNEKNNKRADFGKISGLVGIFCNLFLAAGKILSGLLFSSVSVLADGVNNLSDVAASGITLLGFHFSKKPADKKHPYGHARYEYLAGLVISVLILVVGFELFKTSLEEIFHPAKVIADPFMVAFLILSVVVKTFLFFFYGAMEKRLGSGVLQAVRVDSRNDVLITLTVLISLAAERFFSFPVDGFVSAALALFVLYSGIKLAKETVSPILGEAGDPELQKKITDCFESCSSVIGCHDLIVHDYGPEKRYASIHVEMDRKTDPVLCHSLLDGLERKCLEEYDVHIVTHLDPVEADDPETERLRVRIGTLLKLKDAALTLHDLRITKKEKQREVFFDVTKPDDFPFSEKELENALEEALGVMEGCDFKLHITLHV